MNHYKNIKQEKRVISESDGCQEIVGEKKLRYKKGREDHIKVEE